MTHNLLNGADYTNNYNYSNFRRDNKHILLLKYYFQFLPSIYFTKKQINIYLDNKKRYYFYFINYVTNTIPN